MSIYNLNVPAEVSILALVYSIKEEKRFLEICLFLVGHFLNAVKSVEHQNMIWHSEKHALMAANNRI